MKLKTRSKGFFPIHIEFLEASDQTHFICFATHPFFHFSRGNIKQKT